MMSHLFFLTVGVLSALPVMAWVVDVPIPNDNIAQCGGREKVLAQLKRVDAKWVELAMGKYELDPVRRRTRIAELKENAAFFARNGIVPATRIWALFLPKGQHAYQTLVASDGTPRPLNEFACPLDSAFCEMAEGYVADLARTGVRIIVLDDDLCYGNHYWHGFEVICTCPLHMAQIRRMLGEDVSPLELRRRAMTGGRNRWRDAWLKANGDALRAFALRMRAAVDSVDPTIRLGACTQWSMWDADGVDSIEIAKLLAGKTAPFMRFISGPYWATRGTRGFRLQDVFEYNRLQQSWCGDAVETFGEGDTYPRPRTACPAAYLELYDLLLRASGGVDGNFLYALDYYSPVEYETGYIDRHVRNAPIRAAIDRCFGGKRSAGVRVHERMRKLADAVVPKGQEGTGGYLASFAPSAGAFLAFAGIPTSYEGAGCASIAFGENARYLTAEEMRQGVILDVRAAEVLTGMGVDVGLRMVGEKFTVRGEYFKAEDAVTSVSPSYEAFRLSLDPAAEIDSEYVMNDRDLRGFRKDAARVPAAYRYLNAAGGRFLVYAFDGVFAEARLASGYARARQLRRGVKWLSGRDLPAFTSGNPDVYLLARRSSDALAVGVWNLSADQMLNPVIELDDVYTKVEFINCHGTLDGRKVVLRDVTAYSFVGFEVKK